jgi:hypothetical protein
MSKIADSGPEFFAQLSLPPVISFPGSWASVQPQDATIAAQGLASQLGGTPETLPPAGGSTDSVSAKGKENVATAPALCISLAVHDGTFLSPADRLVRLGQEEVGAFLVVVHMALTANTKTQPFPIVLGAALVPWDVEEVPRLSLGVGATLGPHNVVSCPTLSFQMGFCTHRSTRANANAGVAVDQLIEGSANTPLALDSFQALKLMIISVAAAPPDNSTWSPFFSTDNPALPEGKLPQLLFSLNDPDTPMEGLLVHFSALPLPPNHGLPLGFVARPAVMSLAQVYVSVLKLWSGITDARWDWMINLYYDVWFAAQSLAPESFVMDICSVQQIQTDWLRWIGDAPPVNQESTWSPGTVDPFQHVFLLLCHCVFTDALILKATKQILPKFLEVEARALAVFRHNSALLLGDLSPAMQPFLYCLAHPDTLAWASKYGFQAMQDLVHCPSYVRTLVSFTVPANPNLLACTVLRPLGLSCFSGPSIFARACPKCVSLLTLTQWTTIMISPNSSYLIPIE